jgi:uncharacterized protein YbcV (DUF1398 family)
MNAHVREIVRECTVGSDEERMTFPEVVMKLTEAGVERYHADLIRAEKTYYMPDGDSETVAAAAVTTRPAPVFSAADVDTAVRAIQAQAITYKEFCERIAAAGCVGYFVSLPGRRAVYYGRTAETHVEHFPGAT